MNQRTEIESPVDWLIRRFGMTRLEMTLKYGFGANHLLLAAQGRKDSLGASLLSAFDIEAAEHGWTVDGMIQQKYGVRDFTAAWEGWRREMRRTVDVPQIPASPPSQSPWERIVDSYGSVAKTAQTLRVRDLVVSRYQSKPTMPSSLKEALEDTGWDGVPVLETEQRKFFEHA